MYINNVLFTHTHTLSIAPCQSSGVINCANCNSTHPCPPITTLSCQCTSDCFSQGSCCSDVTTIPNCLGMTFPYQVYLMVDYSIRRTHTLRQKCHCIFIGYYRILHTIHIIIMQIWRFHIHISNVFFLE